ncbi:Putative ribonuclease H protein At1g65750, partial [Linum grandiflorum]
FNLALLWKQGWKLFNDPNALVSRIYKAKYYHNEDFLSAKLGHRPSYAWRSIICSQEIIRAGYRWSIGNGGSISMLNKPWLREEDNCYLETPPSLQLMNLTVSDILIPDLRIWDSEKLCLLLYDRDATAIRGMSTPREDFDDYRLWKFSSRGDYMVRSAYRLASEGIGSLPLFQVPGPWKQLWNIPIQPRVKQLIWRISRQTISTLSNLIQRGVPVQNLCGCCSLPDETVEHLFWHCIFAQDLCQESGLYA